MCIGGTQNLIKIGYIVKEFILYSTYPYRENTNVKKQMHSKIWCEIDKV